MRQHRLASVLMFLAFQLFLLAAKAQDITTAKVTLGLKDDSLETAIKKIEQQSPFLFFYREADVKSVTHLSLNTDTRTIAQTLAILLQNSCLCFRQMDNHILLVRKEPLISCQIKGTVISALDKLPVANASVFLSNATIGAKTGDDGTFSLSNVKPGKYDLIISIVGFETSQQTVTADSRTMTLNPITLSPQTILLDEVRVNWKNDPDREKNYELFKTEFFGTSERARECKILNPEDLDMDYNYPANTLTASSADFLEIENNALGYKVKYLLTNFVKDETNIGTNDIQFGGPAFFEEMKGTRAMEKRWQKRRLDVYEGSVMHFLRSLLNNSYEAEGFRVLKIANVPNPERPPDSLIISRIKDYKSIKHKNRRIRDTLAYWQSKLVMPKTVKTLLPDPLKQGDMVKLTNQKGLFALMGDKCSLYVLYSKSHHFPSKIRTNTLDEPGNNNHTIVNFDAPYVLFDKNGCVMDPSCLSFEGAWGKCRVAELLPVDYDPNGETVEAVNSEPATKENAWLPNPSQSGSTAAPTPQVAREAANGIRASTD